MKVRSITPIRVPEAELRRRQARYRRLAPPGIDITLDNLPDGSHTPRQLDSAAAVDASSQQVLAAARDTDPAVFGLVLPDCVLDPGVERTTDEPVPVVGILQLVSSYLRALRIGFSAVTRNQAIGDELVARLGNYRAADTFVGIDVLDLDFDAISDETRWQEALTPARRRAASRGATVVVNGCSAVDLPDDSGTTVVDPTRLALRLLGVGAAEGLVRARDAREATA